MTMQIAPGITYFPRFVSEPDVALADVMTQVAFVQRSRTLYGRRVATPRLEAWHGPTPYRFGGSEPTPYRFGGSELPAAPLPPVLQALAIRAELSITLRTIDVSDVGPLPAVLTPNDGNTWNVHPRFDSCLTNLYRDGRDSVGWHADDEPEMGDPIIASVSLGARRTFKLRRKPAARSSARAARLGGAPWATPDVIDIDLEHGSLLVMHRGVQAEWEHCLPKRPGCLDPRVNLTFRDCRPVPR